MVAPHDVGRVELGAHPKDTRPLVGRVDSVVARQALNARAPDPHDAAVAHVRRRHRQAREQQGRHRGAAVLVGRQRLELGEPAAEGIGRIQPRLEGAPHRVMEQIGGPLRDAIAAVAVVDRREEALGRGQDRPVVLHVAAPAHVGGGADPGRQGGHGFERPGGSRRGLPAHSDTSSLSSMIA